MEVAHRCFTDLLQVLNKNQCGIQTQIVSLRFQSETNWMNYYKVIAYVVE